MKLTRTAALQAVKDAVRPRSAYINDQVHRQHGQHVRNGGTGHPPTNAVILRRLRSLQSDGLLECIGGPDGYYGFEWRITDLGQAALETGGPS
ncbi:hypothetical protein X747_14905 [Mesorhizobium sp. LNJC384A00]|uniref:hypothetical protein n=1 Tax=unclassified Mesorhizobium TaxID=325217 RepID=UPI0003CF1B7E|nr:hypothetical protein [Mesorhizobium sp. LNJC384A00]ESY42058.1 hypothetical protein X747_14905 [Mesorhizobium sp. LNJC384A00]